MAAGDLVKHILARPIQVADQVTEAADEATAFKQECAELKSKTEKLAALLRQAARAGSDLYERPTRRIVDDTEKVLTKALSLVLKCGRDAGVLRRLFTIIPAAAFRRMSSWLENSIGDLSWLLRVSAPDASDGAEYLGLPPIAANEPILCLIWEQIAVLNTGSLGRRADAASSLVSLARDSARNGKLIIEEGGVAPLLKLVKEGEVEGQEEGARAIGLLGRDPEGVECMIHAGVCSVFAKMLKQGPMKVQAMVAWAVSELAAAYPKSQDLFAQNNIIRLLVSHLAFETVQEHHKYAIASKVTSIHAAVMASHTGPNNTILNDVSNAANIDAEKSKLTHHPFGNKTQITMHNVVSNTMAMKKTPHIPGKTNGDLNISSHHHNYQNQHHHHQNLTHSGTSNRGRESEDPETKANMKAMAARALWHLAKGNSAICHTITESRALLCFAVLIEKGSTDVQFNSSMALMEITAVAEKDPELRRSAFKPNSPACKAVVEQLLKIIEKGHSDLLLPCMKAIGNLARTFRATETRMIGPLVRLLEEQESEVSREALIALTKFACSENYLHIDHSKAIISAGGAKHLVQLVYFGEQMVHVPALVLMCFCAFHVPDCEELAQAEVLTLLQWASKQDHLVRDETMGTLLQEAKGRLELYQSRGSRGFH